MKLSLALCLLLAACGPARTTFARYPGSPAAFDPAQSDAKAVEIADKVFTTAGGASWTGAKQIRWTQVTFKDGAPTREVDEAWDRWNARYWGALHQGDTKMIATHELFGDSATGWSESKEGHHQIFGPEQRDKATKIARDVFQVDTTLLCLPFLLHEPGAKLHYVGPVQADNKDYEQIELTFAAGDTSRSGYTFTVSVDPATNLIYRAEVLNLATKQRAGYLMKDWATISGLQFVGTLENLGDVSQRIQIKGVTVGAPDDQLFLPPLS